MKFQFVWVGKTRNKNYLALQEEYLQRLSHFVKCEIVEVRAAAGSKELKKCRQAEEYEKRRRHEAAKRGNYHRTNDFQTWSISKK